MKNKYFFVAFLMAVIILSVQNASAGVGIQYNSNIDSLTSTTTNYGLAIYGNSLNRQPETLCLGSICFGYDVDETDHIPRGKPLQLIVTYGLEPISDWNIRFPNSTIDYCTILIKEQHRATFGSNITYFVNYTLNRTFTESDLTTTSMSRHFIFLQRGDYAQVIYSCHFTGASQIILTPASFEITAPTKNCLQCTFYNSEVTEFDQTISDILQDYTNEIWGYIITFLLFNMEFLSFGFWTAMTILLLSVISFAFLLLYWLYLFIKSRIKNIER